MPYDKTSRDDDSHSDNGDGYAPASALLPTQESIHDRDDSNSGQSHIARQRFKDINLIHEPKQQEPHQKLVHNDFHPECWDTLAS